MTRSEIVKGLGHVAIETQNLAATEYFYCGLLGLKKQFSFDRDGDEVGFYLAIPGGTYLEIFKHDSVKQHAACLSHFCLETENINQVHAHLSRHSVEVTEVIQAVDGTMPFWFVDPNGIKAEFHQYTNKSSQITGQRVKVNG